MKNTLQKIIQTHVRNKNLLIKEGFTIVSFAVYPNLILQAEHKDGRKVDIRV